MPEVQGDPGTHRRGRARGLLSCADGTHLSAVEGLEVAAPSLSPYVVLLTVIVLGQGALLLSEPKSISNPFYLLFPTWLLYPMIGLATAATVIASQAVITGTYSMTQQAIQLGFLPRTHIVHTSVHAEGRIYIPSTNLSCYWTYAIQGPRSSRS